MLLHEVFDSSVPYKWDTERGASFRIADLEYDVSFGHRQGATSMAFAAEDPKGGYHFGLTGTRNEFIVMSTVLKIIKEYVAKHSPNAITFSAKEPSRISAYLRIAKSLAKEYDIHHETDEWGPEEIFYLTKK